MKFRTFKHLTKETERDTLRIARAQRLTTMQARDPRFADLPNFANRLKALSPAPSKIDTALSNLKNVKGSKVDPKAFLINAALSTHNEKSLSDPSQRSNFRVLRKMQSQLQEPATRGGQTKASPSGGDKRRYNPTGKDFAVTRHGVIASLSRAVGSPFASSWVQAFNHAGQVIPCIQRKKRREVMFAKGKGGRGYRVKHRKTWSTGVPC